LLVHQLKRKLYTSHIRLKLPNGKHSYRFDTVSVQSLTSTLLTPISGELAALNFTWNECKFPQDLECDFLHCRPYRMANNYDLTIYNKDML
jgi:hypothetical protein